MHTLSLAHTGTDPLTHHVMQKLAVIPTINDSLYFPDSRAGAGGDTLGLFARCVWNVLYSCSFLVCRHTGITHLTSGKQGVGWAVASSVGGLLIFIVAMT